LRRLTAFKADVLTAIGRIAVEAVFASYRARAKRRGIDHGQCGAINFVQRFGSLNLHVHFHVVVLDGVFTRDADAAAIFHPASAPAREDLDAIVRRVQKRAETWVRRHGYVDERTLAERSNEPPAQTALDACAAIAMGRGQVATLPNAEAPDDDHDEEAASKPAVAVEPRRPEQASSSCAASGYASNVSFMNSVPLLVSRPRSGNGILVRSVSTAWTTSVACRKTRTAHSVHPLAMSVSVSV
jgi:hypothetical protein